MQSSKTIEIDGNSLYGYRSSGGFAVLSTKDNIELLKKIYMSSESCLFSFENSSIFGIITHLEVCGSNPEIGQIFFTVRELK